MLATCMALIFSSTISSYSATVHAPVAISVVRCHTVSQDASANSANIIGKANGPAQFDAT